MRRFLVALLSLGLMLLLGAARPEVTCQCTYNIYPGGFQPNPASCDSEPDRAITDNSVCNASVYPNDCRVTGTLTADLCGGDSCVYARTDIPGGLSAYNWGSSATSGFQFTAIPSPAGETTVCTGIVTRFVRFEFTNGSQSGNACTGNSRAVWMRDYKCVPPQ